ADQPSKPDSPKQAPPAKPSQKAQPPKGQENPDGLVWFGSFFQPPPLDVSWMLMQTAGVPDDRIEKVRKEYAAYAGKSVSLQWNYLNALKNYSEIVRKKSASSQQVDTAIQKIADAQREFVAAGVAFWMKLDSLLGEEAPQFLAGYGPLAERSTKVHALPASIALFAPPPENSGEDIVRVLGLTDQQVAKIGPLATKYGPDFEKVVKSYTTKLGSLFGLFESGYPLPWDQLQTKSNDVISAESVGLKLEAGLWGDLSNILIESQMDLLWQGLMGKRMKALLAVKYGALPPATEG
ncbi:MAG: hypothetical protein ACREJQ_01825, partial [bacterium]